MNGAVQPLLADQFAAALAWWRDAGVDSDYLETPVQWLAGEAAEAPVAADVAAAPARSATPAPPPAEPIGGPQAGWPETLAEFAGWWLSEPSLDDGTVQGRVAPRGSAGAELMVLVALPEAADSEILLSGAEGQLLDAFLAAAGIASENVYRAAVLPRHTPLPDWAGLGAAGLGAVLAHHVGLVRPARLLVFGENILPLIGHAPAQSTKDLLSFYHDGRSVPVLGAYELGAMLGRPNAKARFWQRWLDWTGNKSA
jgi:DNA polymerase